MGLKKLLQSYLQHLEVERGYSPRTLKVYHIFLARFLEWTKADKPEGITQETITDFRLKLNRFQDPQRGPLSKKTQNYYLIALRGFLKFLIKQGCQTFPPERIELAKVPERQIDFLDENEMERLMNAPQGNGLRPLRDRAMLEILFSTGLRVSELCALDRYTIDLAKDEFSVRGKGGKIRIVFLSPRAKKTLKEYLDARPDTNEALFIGIPRGDNLAALLRQEQNRMAVRTVERIIKKYATGAGIARKVTPHTLRHMLGTQLLRGGANLRAVQMILGHSNVSTTQIYTHYTNEELREAHKKFLKRETGQEKDV